MTATSYVGMELPILEARLDWITCTAKHDENGITLMTHGDRQVAIQVRDGNKAERWKFQGYDGFRAGSWAYGWGREGAIVVVTQAEAQRHAHILAELADHWSRVDYCVTVLDTEGTMQPDNDYWTLWHERWEGKEAPVKCRRTQEAWGGATIYIGDRASAYLTRVYNKHEESKARYPKGAWRWEVELKRHASEGQQRRWREAYQLGGYPLGVISGEMKRYGLHVPWQVSSIPQRDPQIKPLSTLDTKLAWLERCVRGPIEDCCALGGYERVLEALNLPRYRIN